MNSPTANEAASLEHTGMSHKN